MRTPTPQRLDYEVRQRVEVTLNRASVEHALRCYLAHVLATGGNDVPVPRSFSAIDVGFEIDAENSTTSGLSEVTGAVLRYEPEPVPPGAPGSPAVDAGTVAAPEVPRVTPHHDVDENQPF